MIYHIYANRSNIGDWISAKGIQNLLSPLEVTECLCDRPFVKNTIERLSTATEKDLVIIGGGGLLMDYFLPFWKAFKPIAQRVPFCIWGIGYCDLKRRSSLISKKLIESIISKSKLTIVRDELSRSYLQGIQLTAPVPCPGVNYINSTGEHGKGIIHVVNYEASGADAYETMHIAARRFAENTTRTYWETNHRIPNHSTEHMNVILEHYQNSDIVISSALHGCVIGVAMGLKVIAVSGDRKIDAFMAAIGLSDWVLDVSEASLLFDRLHDLELQSVPIDALQKIRRKNVEIARKIQRIAFATTDPKHSIENVT